MSVVSIKKLLFLFLLLPFSASAQIISEDGNLMGEFVYYEQNLMPDEDSEGFIVPDSLQLKQWKRMMDLFVAESYSQAEDSLSTNFSNYEMVLLTDTSFIDREYYLIREKTPIVYGWGMFASDPDYQRDAIIAVPHPLHDSNTPQQGVNLFQYLGARALVMAGTHRCANADSAVSDGTTTVCNDTDTSEKFKVSDMAHYDSSAFQIAHESMKELSANVYALNVHGHASSSCEDVYLSNGRSDDPQPSLTALRDTLIAHGIDAAMTGDGSSCTLSGTTNVQGRYMNGSANPADDQPDSNTGYFFHMEQSSVIRRSLDGHKKVIDAFATLIPRSFNTVTFPDYPSLTFNEIHPFPAADANNNGNVGTVSDEFLEIINTADAAIALDGWIIADNSEDRHVIETNTNIFPGRALLVFGNSSFVGDFGGANVQGASTDALSLNNSGDKLYIKTPANDVITYLEYPGDISGESLTLFPDISGDSLYAHSNADTADASLFSPGTKINGDSFHPFITISGDAGWRMMASPSIDMPINELTSFTPVQGFGDSQDTSFYNSYSGFEWEAPSSLGDSLENGKGFILYFFDNDIEGSSELPVTIRATGMVPDSDVDIALHTDGDGWNLIGNPFDKGIDFSEITANGGSLSSSVGQIYDPSTQNYVTTTSIGDSVAAWQGIMVQNSTAASITIPTSSLIEGGNFLKRASEEFSYVVFTVSDAGNKIADQFVVYFSESSELEWDQKDALELPSLNSTALSFSGVRLLNNQEVLQTQISLPSELSEPVSIPLRIEGFNSSPTVSMRISKQVRVNEHFAFSIINTLTGEVVNLEQAAPYSVQLTNQTSTDLSLVISPASSVANETHETTPYRFKVSQNYPNPFNPSTVINYQLPVSSKVSVKVYTIHGSLVAELVNEVRPAGKHQIRFDASSLSSGMYLYKVEMVFGTQIRKMLLIK